LEIEISIKLRQKIFLLLPSVDSSHPVEEYFNPSYKKLKSTKFLRLKGKVSFPSSNC
jgi:hypothetical protein